jgi:hypothetical protein
LELETQHAITPLVIDQIKQPGFTDTALQLIGNGSYHLEEENIMDQTSLHYYFSLYGLYTLRVPAFSSPVLRPIGALA